MFSSGMSSGFQTKLGVFRDLLYDSFGAGGSFIQHAFNGAATF